MGDLSMATVIQITIALLITLHVVMMQLVNLLPLLCIWGFASARSDSKIMELIYVLKYMVIISLYIYMYKQL